MAPLYCLFEYDVITGLLAWWWSSLCVMVHCSAETTDIYKGQIECIFSLINFALFIFDIVRVFHFETVKFIKIDYLTSGLSFKNLTLLRFQFFFFLLWSYETHKVLVQSKPNSNNISQSKLNKFFLYLSETFSKAINTLEN